MSSQQILLGGGGKAGPTDINLYFQARFGADTYSIGQSTNYTGATVADYWSGASENFYSGQKANTFTQNDFTRVGDGILSFPLPAGSYKIEARSASGTGNGAWTGMKFGVADLTLAADEDILLLIPNHGLGNYAAGGGLFLVKGSDYTDANNTPLLILGGGGGGYSAANTWSKPGPLTADNLNTARRGPSTAGSGDYDGGAGFLNTYTPEITSGNNRPYHFVQGGRGGCYDGCGTLGGFGGGGGACPGGGGGARGGFPGTNSHNHGSGYGGNTNHYGTQMGGGGGTSYYNSSYISNITNIDYGNTLNQNFTTRNHNYGGYFGIYTV